MEEKSKFNLNLNLTHIRKELNVTTMILHTILYILLGQVKYIRHFSTTLDQHSGLFYDS